MSRNTCLTIVGAVLALFGVGVLILGLFVSPKELPSVFRNQVDDFVIVDSEHSQAYNGWAGQNDVDNPYYVVIYMFNLTNVNDVIHAGAVPAYEQVGPYMYRRYRQSVNVSFLNDGDLVQYNDFMDFYFDQNASGTLSESDMFTNINPVNIGGLMQAVVPNSMFNAEFNMYMAASGGMIRSFTDYFTGPFISLFTAYNFSSFFTPIMNANIAALNTTSPQQVFIDIWRNGTTAPNSGNWTGMLLNGNTPANISSYSAQLLLNAAVPFSLLDNSYEAIWFWDQSIYNMSIAQNLTTTFQITLEQITIVWNWRNNVFGPTRMYPSFISEFGLDEISDIGWVQWASQGVLHNSVSTVFPDAPAVGIYAPIEIDSTAMSWREWRTVMDPNSGLENITTIQAFLKAFGVNQSGNFSEWGLNTTTGPALGSYVLQILATQAVPAIYANAGQSGGLFVTKSVNEWAFNCNDYLLNLLQENPPLCSFRYNHTSKAPNTIYTGKSDINLINNYHLWEGQSQVDFWQTPLNVSGFTELGQFAPDHTSHAQYSVFQEDSARIVYLNYTGNVTVEGIESDRYILDFNRTFGISDYFYQPFNGLANISAVQSGSPIFLSLWDMLYVDDSIANVTGLNATNEWEDNTVIDIEPVTGITVQCRRRMQVNVYVPPDNAIWYNQTGSIFNNNNFTTGIAFPLAKMGEYATISPDMAKKLRDKLAIPPRVRHITFYVGVIGGPVLIVIGASLIFVARKKAHHHHHHDETERLVVNNHH